MESLPNVFWVFYGVILSLAFVTSLAYWIKRRYSALAAIGIIFSPLTPLVSLVYTAQRNTGTELQYMKEKLATWDSLAIAILIGYVFILVWTFLVIFDVIRKVYHFPFIYRRLHPFFKEKVHPIWDKWISYVKRVLPKKNRKKEQTLEEKTESGVQ